MKNLKIITIFVILLSLQCVALSQDVNWASLQAKQRHIITLHAGVENGVVFGVRYGYQLKTKMPVILNAEYSFPAGKDLVNDFKTKLGAQIKLYKTGGFQFSAKVQGVFRRYENSLVRMVNFGSDMSGIVGFYKAKWFVAGEFGFDKAIVTSFKHTDRYREIFPGVKDGWYEPATGGNFYYGIQTGHSFKSNDVYLKVGQQIEEDFKTKPALPFYFQIGINKRL